MKKQTYKIELEKIILAVMLNDLNSIEYISRMISVDDLSKDYRDLYLKLLNLYTNETDNNIIELGLIREFGAAKIHSLKNRDFVATLDYLLKNNIIYHFKDVCYSLEVEKFLKQGIESVKNDFQGLDTLEVLNKEIQDLINSKENHKEEKSLSEKFSEIAEDYKARLNNKYSELYNFRNIPSFNFATGGIVPTNLITIAGFTGQGKTFLALNMLLDLAQQKIPVGFISLEQSESEITDRLIGILTGVTANKLRRPRTLDESELSKISFEALSKFDLPIYVNDRPLTEIDIKTKIKYWKDRFNVKAVCVDYIGLMQSKTKFASRERELAYYSEFLKITAKELNVIIIILSQLNRAGKERPNIDNLAESIGLARDSDFLFTIFKPLDTGINKDDNGNKFDESNFLLKCEKNRHNKNKRQILLKLRDSGEFVEISTKYDKILDQVFSGE